MVYRGRRVFVAALCGVLASAWAASSVAAAPDPGATRVTENLYDATALPGGTTWRVGAFGLVSRSTDGGRTWQTIPSRTTETLFSVDFANQSIGWIVGRAGLILHTFDGGATWTPQPSGTANHLFAVTALGPEEAWAIGDWGTILRTTDGGETWDDRSLTEDVILNSMSWVDRRHGWIAGEVGAIYRTEDGGESWVRQESGSEKSLFDVHFTDRRRGWAVGLDGVLVRTEDGGESWQVLRGNPEVGSLDAMGFLEALKNAGLYAVRVQGDFGIAAGDLGIILVSRDGGLTWSEQEVPEEWRLRWIRGLSLGKDANGVLVGSNGLTIPVADGVLRYPGR
jgi:photosystem II stability/assembly factor-like uncharacterized protein